MSDETRQIDDGRPAFPTSEVQKTRNIEGGFTVAFKDGAQGMSLRDWLAGQAMAAFIGAACRNPFFKDDEGLAPDEAVARDAYRMADAMLAARGGGR